MLFPSKELLSEVLELDGIDRIDFERNSIFINYFYEINIHELAYKCKEWAFDKGYSVYATQYKIDDVEWCIYVFKDKDMHDYGCDIRDTTFKTEPEAIFKACEYIMEQAK